MYRTLGLAALASLSTAVAVQAQAQTQTTVSGQVVNEETGTALAAAGVTVISRATSAPVSGAVTDADGRFVVTGLPAGEYTVSAAHAGFATASTPLLIGTRNTAYNLGRIALAADTAVEELVVVAEATQAVAPNVNVFSMDANVASSAGSVLDALKSLPGITIGQEGEVQLRGNDRVPILIDGKPSALTGFGNQSSLDSIPAGSIERIEIINNPSARYDAAGMAGIINIIYKTDKKLGWHGDVGFAAGVGALTRRKADIPTALGSFDFNHRVAPSLNLTYNSDRLTAFFQAEAIHREDLPNNEFHTRFYDDGRVLYSQIPENRQQTRLIVKGGGDFRMDGRNTFTLSSMFDREHHKDKAQIPFLNERGVQERYWSWIERETTGFFNVTGAWKHQFAAPGRQITLNIQYTRAWEDEAYTLAEVSPVRIGGDFTHLKAVEQNIPITLDYVHPTKSGRLEAGAKVQFRNIPVKYITERGFRSIIYPGLGDESTWKEKIYAAYANYVHETQRYAVEAGLRAERTEVDYELDPANIYYPRSDAYDYNKLFANVRLTWNLTGSSSLSVFYNNRVDRPGEPELRVFPKYDDPENLKVGNPYLRPQFTRTYEARYQHRWGGGGSLSVSAYRRSISDPFIRVYAIDPTNANYDIINKIYQNVGHATNTGIEVLAGKRLTPWLNLNGSVNWYVNKIDPFTIQLLFPIPRPLFIEESKDSTWDGKLNAQVELPWKLQLNLSGAYYAARNIPQGTQSARSSIDFSLTRKFMDNRLEATLSGTDILNKFGLEQEIEGAGFRTVYQNFYQTQAFSLALKYSF